MKIYVASSWRNEFQPEVVRVLREAGHEVYDFRNPHFGALRRGFSWSEIDPQWKKWTATQTREAYDHDLATHGLGADFAGMNWADVILMVQPCGPSSALELGWGIGARKRTIVLLRDGCEPDLMFGLADRLCVSLEEVLVAVVPPEPWRYASAMFSSKDGGK